MTKMQLETQFWSSEKSSGVKTPFKKIIQGVEREKSRVPRNINMEESGQEREVQKQRDQGPETLVLRAKD